VLRVCLITPVSGPVAKLLRDLARSPCSLARLLRDPPVLGGTIWSTGCEVVMLASDLVLGLDHFQGELDEAVPQPCHIREGGLAGLVVRPSLSVQFPPGCGGFSLDGLLVSLSLQAAAVDRCLAPCELLRVGRESGAAVLDGFEHALFQRLGGDLRGPGQLVDTRLAFVDLFVALVGSRLALVGESFAFVGGLFAPVGSCLAPVGEPFAFVGGLLALVGLVVALADDALPLSCGWVLLLGLWLLLGGRPRLLVGGSADVAEPATLGVCRLTAVGCLCRVLRIHTTIMRLLAGVATHRGPGS
jgi:hypothetical protein